MVFQNILVNYPTLFFLEKCFGSIIIKPIPKIIINPPNITSKDGTSPKKIIAPIIALTGMSNKKGMATGIACFEIM